ncbi:MAG: STAS domain-containing protein [Anaerolineales bacterium]|nr:STAS domain-containing protein [Anaerolineales bacterium]
MSSKPVTKTEKPRGISRILPILSWLPNYDRSWLKGDLIAGLSVWALMVPTSLGYATISGVPVQYGLYAAAMGLIAFALFTTSKQVTQGPSSSTAAVLGAAVLAVASAGSDEAVAVAAAIVFVAGLLFIIMYLLKMGWISEFLSASVLTGFTFGVAINVAAGELFKITGTEKAGSNTWGKLWNWIIELPETSMPTLVVGGSALVLVFAIKIFAPKIPGALVAVILGIAATAVFNLGDLGVALIAEVPSGLPTFVLPDFGMILDNLAMIVGAAVGLLLIGFSVTTAAVRDYANKHNYRIDINQELLAQGMSNVSSGLFQGIFDNGSLSKSPVNDQAGARSQISNLAQAVFIILTLLFLAPLFSALPEAVLGAIIIQAVVMGMMDVGEMKRIYKVKRFEFLAALAALLGVMTFGILQGVVIGVVLSIIWLVAVSALPYIPELGRKPGTHAFFDLQQHPDGETYPGLSILRFDGGLFFVNADALGDRLREVRVHSESMLNGVILSMEGVNFIDTEGADIIMKIAQAGVENDIDLHLARLKPQVLEVLQRDGVIDMIGAEHIHDDIAAAVELHLSRHAPDSLDKLDS